MQWQTERHVRKKMEAFTRHNVCGAVKFRIDNKWMCSNNIGTLKSYQLKNVCDTTSANESKWCFYCITLHIHHPISMLRLVLSVWDRERGGRGKEGRYEHGKSKCLYNSSIVSVCRRFETVMCHDCMHEYYCEYAGRTYYAVWCVCVWTEWAFAMDAQASFHTLLFDFAHRTDISVFLFLPADRKKRNCSNSRIRHGSPFGRLIFRVSNTAIAAAYSCALIGSSCFDLLENCVSHSLLCHFISQKNNSEFVVSAPLFWTMSIIFGRHEAIIIFAP